MAFPTTDLECRYEAKDETAYSDGDAATTITDQSTNGRDLIGSNGLSWQDGEINGHAVYRLDGVDDDGNWSGSMSPTLTAFSVAVLAKATTEASSRKWPFGCNDSTDHIMAFTEGETASEWGIFARTSTATVQQATSGVDTTTYVLLLLVWDGASVSFYVDNELVSSDSLGGDFQFDGIRLGNIGLSGEFFGGDEALGAAWSKALTSTERDDLADYTTTTYGVPAGSGGADHQLAPADATHSHTASSPTLTQHHSLAPDDSTHGHAASEPTLTQTYALAPQDASHSHVAGEPALTQAHQLAPADSSHSHTASEPALSQVHAHAPDDASHAHSASSPALTQHHTLTPADATHSHTASEPGLTLAGTLTPEDATHGHTASEPSLTQHHQLAPADATHGHVAGEPALTVTTTLTPDDASHLHTASSPGLTQVHVLAPDDSTHTHTADEPSLSQLHRLAPTDATHTHTATSPGLTSRDESAVTPASRTLTVEAEDRTLVVAAETRVLEVATEDRTLRVRG